MMVASRIASVLAFLSIQLAAQPSPQTAPPPQTRTGIASDLLSDTRKAAEAGDARAQFNLGFSYYLGVPAKDYAEAARWFRKAADQGYVAAQFRLGQLYFSGQGVPQDYVQAHMWVNLAAAHANGDYQQMFAAARDEVAAKMDAAQIAEAQRLAREWKPTK